MGEGAVAGESQVILSPGIGSCVVVTLYDTARRLGGMAHVMLPDSGDVPERAGSYQCADTAIPALREAVCRRGAVLSNLVAKIAGGAAMFASYTNGSTGIGKQIIHSVRAVLSRERIPLVGWDVAGHHGRTVEFYLASGQMVVKTLGSHDKTF
jgi:chemotaxis protein CheD